MTQPSLYQIGPLCFSLDCAGIPVPANLQQFRISTGTPEYRYVLELSDALSWDRQDFQVHKDQLCIALNGDLETRYLCIPGSDHPYGIAEEHEDRTTLVRFDRRDLALLDYDNVFCSLLSLERRMAELDAFVLHSAYIAYQGEAILFTAPSGVGKSTQADLWKQHRGARIINGDRSLLQFRDGKLVASGWPVCGSSGICRNESFPVRAIVLLDQAPENQVRKLSRKELTLRLMREITINYHNPAYFDSAMEFLSCLIDGTGLWNLHCTVSREAVECLERAIYPPEAHTGGHYGR